MSRRPVVIALSSLGGLVLALCGGSAAPRAHAERCTLGAVVEICSYLSSVDVSDTALTFAPLADTAPGQVPTLVGNLGVTAYDGRGSNSGFIVSVTAHDFTSSASTATIPARDVTISGAPSVAMACFGPYGCSPALPYPGHVGAALDTSVPVAIECPLGSIGAGDYAVDVPLAIALPGDLARAFASNPSSWTGSFTVSVTEGLDVNSFQTYGCPAFNA